MRYFVLALVLSFAACSHGPQNKAAVFARAIATGDDMACTKLRTGQVGKPDTAICESSNVMLFCRAGGGLKKGCSLMHDFNPESPKEQAQQSQPPAPQPEQPKIESPPAPPAPGAATPAVAPSSPPATPAKVDTKKPEPGKK